MISSFFFKQRSCRISVAVVCIAVLVVGLALAIGGCGSKSGLVGKWHSDAQAETVEFTSDGKMTVTSDAGDVTSMTYVAADGKLTLTLADQNFEVSYVLTGDTLTVTDTETQEPVAYQRVE
jgi:hypothetical protein